jgi:TolB-like protein/DNA-binding winged helix-turn-helix (wHTH) protein/tetratricopeptide (TPR) repeat protein
MRMATPASIDRRVVRFGVFEVDLQLRELRKNGLRIKLEGQPLTILMLLIERPGELLTREELQKKLWPDGTNVDFEHSINVAITRLRETLQDSASAPHFIETLPRRGYRFIYPVESPGGLPADSPRHRSRRLLWGFALSVTLIASALVFVPSLKRLWVPTKVHRIVVLPFKNLTGDAAQSVLVDGITDLLTTELAQVKEIDVVSVTSAMHYKDTRQTLPEIAKDLGVDAAIEGSVQQDEEHVMVTVQLVSTADRHLWANTFEYPRNQTVLARGDIARGIMRELGIKLTPAGEQRVARVRTSNPEAQIAYMKARDVWFRRFREDTLQKSVQSYELAIQKDPSFAEAYSGMAFSLAALNQLQPSPENSTKLGAALDQAIALDPQLGEPHALNGFLRQDEAECRRALELSPNDALSHLFYAALLTNLGRYAESLAEMRRAEHLDPLSAYISANVILRLTMLGRFEEAVAQSNKALELDPEFWLTYQWMGGAYWHLKQFDRAIAAWEKVVSLNAGYETWALPRLIAAYMTVGRKQDAIAAFNRLLQISQTRYVTPFGLALAYVAVGKKEAGLALLEKAEKDGRDLGIRPPELKLLMRNDPRFSRFMAQRRHPTPE